MSWASTPVSTGISSRLGRPRATASTAAPVTNIASVDSMNGAPRIAPTPIPWESDVPPPDRIAMIGIIVSGSAVPTAARTDPTAPSASCSFRPKHSMPFVKSSAPSRMRTKATARIRTSIERLGLRVAQDDAQRDHDEDQRGDDRHRPLAADDETAERDDDAHDRCREQDQQPQPDEPGLLEVGDVVDDQAGLERRAAGQRVAPGGEQQDAAHTEQQS